MCVHKVRSYSPKGQLAYQLNKRLLIESKGEIEHNLLLDNVLAK